MNVSEWLKWPTALKRRVCRFLLQHYFGKFLGENLTLDQLELSMDLQSGHGKVENMSLDIDAINEMLSKAGSPMEIVNGYIGCIEVRVPWRSLHCDNCEVQIQGLELTLQPKCGLSGDVGDLTSSLYRSLSEMTTSMQLAEGCLKSANKSNTTTFGGLDVLASALESVLTRAEVSFTDTIVRLAEIPDDQDSSIAVEICIDQIDIFDEVSVNVADVEKETETDTDDKTTDAQTEVLSTKCFRVSGVEIFLDEVSVNESAKSYSPEQCPSPVDSDIFFEPFNNLNQEQTNCSSSDKAEPVLIAKLFGNHEIKVRVCEGTLGTPKVDIGCLIESFAVFLSPHQVHLLLRFAHSISSSLMDLSNAGGSAHAQSHIPKTTAKANGGNRLRFSDSHSSSAVSHTQKRDLMKPGPISVQGRRRGRAGSEYGGSVSSLCTGFTDVLSPQHEKPFQNEKSPQDDTGKVTLSTSSEDKTQPNQEPVVNCRYKVCIGGFVMTLLHSNPSPTPSDQLQTDDLSFKPASNFQTNCDATKYIPKSTCDNVDQTQRYFASCGAILIDTLKKDKYLPLSRDELAAACGTDHLCLTANTVRLTMDIKSPVLNVEVSFGKVELTESLLAHELLSPTNTAQTSSIGKGLPKKPGQCFEHAQLLKFLNNEMIPASKSHTSPDVRIRFNSQKTKKKMQTSLHVHMVACETEVDVSIIDRINALVSYNDLPQKSTSDTASLSQPMSTGFHSAYSHFQKQDLNEALSEDVNDRQVDIDVSCSFLKILFRFPVADLRPEVQRRPWYTRLLRDEILILEAHSFAVSTSFASSEKPEQFYQPGTRGPSQSDPSLEQLGFEVTFKDLHVLYSDVPDHPKSFIYISQAPSDMDSTGTTIDGVTDLDYPIIKVTFRSTNGDRNIPITSVDNDSSSRQKTHRHDNNISSSDSEDIDPTFTLQKKGLSPFAGSRVFYAGKEVIQPGDADEVSEFVEHAISTSHVYLLIKLPAVNMFLESHAFFENLYNRINNDILLWTPAAPKPHLLKKTFSGEYDCLNDQGSLDLASRLSIQCDNGDNLGTWSGSDDADCYELPSMHGTKTARVGNNVSNKQSLFSITTKIGCGKILTKCNTLTPDETVSDTEHGEVVVMLENATISYVSGYCGNPNLDYVCTQIKEFELFHKADVQSSGTFPSNIGAYSESRPMHLDQVISKCCKGIKRTFHRTHSEDESGPPMLDLAIKIETDNTSNRRYLISACLNNALLEHRFVEPGCNWFEQIANFFDATDDQVLGYEPPRIVTEINLSLYKSAVAYKPLYMSPAVRAVVTVSSFCFCSTMITDENKSVIDLILNKGWLYITNELDSMDLKSNYACIVDIDRFQLCLTYFDVLQDFTECDMLTEPIVDISLSNNTINIGTCTDSFILLCSLIRYISDNGDFRKSIVKCEEKSPRDSIESTDEQAVAQEESEKRENDDELAQLLAEAMMDISLKKRPSKVRFSPSNTSNSPGNFNSKSMMEMRRPHQMNSGIMGKSMYVHRHCNRPPFGPSKSLNEFVDDDEFCIIDDGLVSLKSESAPLIKYRNCEDSELEPKILVVDDHFEPSSEKFNQLKAPEHFPLPVLVYSLNNLNLIWYMYGGNDFHTVDSPPMQKKSNFGASDANSRNCSSPMPTRRSSYKSGCRKNTTSSRDITKYMELHLDNVSARYEEYPEDTYEATRFVLMVNNFEIRDKLQSSSINKFLYRFHSESSPKQSNAKAFLVKLLQIRPDGVDAPLENKLKISLQPLRFNIDQDSLNFLTNYFAEISAVLSDDESESAGSSQHGGDDFTRSMHGDHASPVMDGNMSENVPTASYSDVSDRNAHSPMQKSPMDWMFFREVVFSPAVPIRLDYHGKRIDTEQGAVAGLLMGLGRLNCSELCLKKIIHRNGLLGADKVVTFLLNEWASDIRANQLPSILGGVGPIHSVTQVFKGFRDLLFFPVEQYRKDGRIVRGIQRGASSFGTSTVMATLEVANGAIGLLQSAAETTYELVSPSDSNAQGQEEQNWRTLARHARRGQPMDLHEGVSNAYTVVMHGVEETATSIVKQAQKEHGRRGVTAAVGVVLRNIPPALVRPVIVATEATSNVLSGIRNQIKPDAKQEDEDKWKNAKP